MAESLGVGLLRYAVPYTFGPMSERSVDLRLPIDRSGRIGWQSLVSSLVREALRV